MKIIPMFFWLVFDVLRPQVFGSDVALVGLVVPSLPSQGCQVVVVGFCN